MMQQKYVITDNDCIIVFPASMNHSDFKDFNPVRAGFIKIYINSGGLAAACYGESVSLKLKSDPKVDERIANFQLSLL